jgi:hypothetical protein
MQKKAVAFLNTHAFSTPQWLLERDLLDRIESNGAIERVQALQTTSLNNLLNEKRLQRMIANEQVNGREVYTAVEMMADLRSGIFKELYAGKEQMLIAGIYNVLL